MQQHINWKAGLAALLVLVGNSLPIHGQSQTATFSIGSTIVQNASNQFGINLDWPYYNNWTHDPGMEPVAVNLRGTATGGGSDFVLNDGPVDTTFNGAFTDGFFVNAAIRIYREVNGAVTLLRSNTVTEYYASSNTDFRINLDATGPAVQAGDVYYLNLVADNVPAASVPPSVQANLPMADPWSPIGPVDQFRDRATVAPVDGGQTSMRLHTDQPEYVGMFQYRYGPLDLWMDSLDHGEPYRMEVWLRQEGRASDEVVLWMDEGYDQINTIFSGVDGTWQLFQYDFIAPARPAAGDPAIPQGLVFEGPGTVWVDNFRVYKTTEPVFSYQQDKIDALREANPETVRLWGGVANEQLGSTLDDWTSSEAVSLRQYNPEYGAQYSDTALKLPTALPVVAELNASPWFTFGPYHSEEEIHRFIEFMAGPVGTPGGDKRAAQGQIQPWVHLFPRMFFEFGNESWLSLFLWQMEPEEYGHYAEYFFQVVQSSPYYPAIANKIVFVINGALDESATTDYGHVAIQHCPSAHMVDIAPYIGGWESNVEFGNGSVNDAGFQEYLLFPAARIKHHTDIHAQSRDTLAAQGIDYDLITYEFGPGTQLPTGNTPVQWVMEAYGKSLAAGVATLDIMLDMQRNHYFAGNYFQFSGGTSYATHTHPEADFRPHPSWLAVQLANEHAMDARVAAQAVNVPTQFVAGEDEFPDADVPLVDLHAYRDGNDYTAILLSRSLDAETLVTLQLPFNQITSATRHMMTGDPRTNNTVSELITVQTEAFTPTLNGSSYTFPLPPGSVYVLEFSGTTVTPTAPQPIIGLAASQGSPTSDATIDFHVAFTETVTGLDSSDVVFSGTALPVSIQVDDAWPYDGSQYTVSVNVQNVSGSVDITLPAGAVTNLANLSSLAATATHAPVQFEQTNYPGFLTPAAGSTLTGTSSTIEWTTGDFNVDTFILEVGSQPEWDDVYAGTFTGQTLSALVDTLPDDGRTLHVRLYYIIGWQWAYEDITLQAYEAPPLPAPALTFPTTNVSGTSAVFTWTDNGNTVDHWYLDVGTSPGSSDLLEGNFTGSQQSATVSGLPANGSTIHATLWYLIDWTWTSADYQFQSQP